MIKTITVKIFIEKATKRYVYGGEKVTEYKMAGQNL